MKSLSTIERMILEALGTNSKSLYEVQHETGLTENITFNLLQALIIKGLVAADKDGYSIGKHIPQNIIDALNSDKSRKLEAIELLTIMIESPKQEEFKMRKVYLEEKDEKIFNSLLIQMEMLISEANKKNKNGHLKNSKVIFWAYDTYGSLINRMIQQG